MLDSLLKPKQVEVFGSAAEKIWVNEGSGSDILPAS